VKKRDGLWLLLLGVGGVALISGTASASSSPPPDPRRPRPPLPPGSEIAPQVTDQTALARVIRSEAGTQTLPEKVAVAWVCRNAARDRQRSVAQLVCAPCGPQAGFRRPFSTAQAPTDDDLRVAATVLGMSQEMDVTDGAINCFEPDLQDRLHAAGRAKDDANAIRARWTSRYGLERYGRVGNWELYGRQRAPRPAPAAPAAAATA
jgi:hypothetical protein